jgi:hypothetical protein
MDQKLLNRVRALLAKAESTDFPAEAETYTERAHALMAQHGIEQAQLADAGKINDEIISMRIDMTGTYTAEKTRLLVQIALACRSRTVRYGPPGSSAVAYCVVVGHKSDLERIEVTYTSLLLQAAGQIKHQRPPLDIYGDLTSSVTVYRRSWFNGFAYAVGARLEAIEARAAAQDKAQQATTTSGEPGTRSTELVLLDRKTKVDAAYNELFGDLPKVKSRNQINPDAYYSGQAAGRRADLGQTRVTASRTAIR